ncbi:glycine betaine ABC transporter substrate-binding protein [Paenibacillus sacheonensis]|uniref:Osmoprotectant ABC transporter substrate-binding protein n=1 Tax=Paenibacillus sacheonensis TaxID=742054 RepID=A0A7X4YLS2_9BACL|nr:glycine betaine ABC transporter substrate-binding protein [Paenibacillus sacheonensis]MBM7565981.1 osmoprotectant transport system substrate-binding protein [Paenibacillus sacheonensis]NBC68705.1 osmoprotectant ABC transporter substrate-binding protein [Paenibacillus sacheonensis]
MIAKLNHTITLLVLCAMAMLLGACGTGNTFTIGAQTFTETKILAEMYKALIEDRTDVNVEIIPDLASSPVVLQAIKRNDLQMGTLYSGEIFNNHFPIQDTKDRKQVLAQAQAGFKKYYDLDWLDPLGFENTYAFTVRADLAKAKGYENISDIQADAAGMRLGVDTSWLERASDGYPAFSAFYGITFGKAFPMELSLVYKAVAQDQVDIVLAYSTDSRLKAYRLKTLKDDKHFFPPYDASPVIRDDAAKKYPGVTEAVSELIGTIDEQTMIDLNYEVDIEKKSEREVALAYLKRVGLLQA